MAFFRILQGRRFLPDASFVVWVPKIGLEEANLRKAFGLVDYIPNIQRSMWNSSETCRSHSRVFSNVPQSVSCSGRMFTVRSRKGA